MVKSSIRFLSHDSRYCSEKPYTLRFTPSMQFPRSNIETEHRNDLDIEDVRGREPDFTVNRNGFTIIPFETKLSYDDFDDEAKVVDIYLREVANELRDLLGAKKVLILEHLVRKRHPTFPISTGEKYRYNQPTTLAHIDTTLKWAAQKLEDLSHEPGRGQIKSTAHYQFINMWKPLKGPVQDWPLALCDNSSIDPLHDLQASDLVFADNVVENCQVYYTSRQRWYYISSQEVTEAWVFVQADSAEGARPGEFDRLGAIFTGNRGGWIADER